MRNDDITIKNNLTTIRLEANDMNCALASISFAHSNPPHGYRFISASVRGSWPKGGRKQKLYLSYKLSHDTEPIVGPENWRANLLAEIRLARGGAASPGRGSERTQNRA